MNQNSLVLYKEHPALIKHAEEKLEIELPNSKTRKVRPKDVTLLHPGPIQSLGDLQPQTGEVETAWELLAGETTTLPELAELIYEIYTPATAWATWQLIAEGLYFQGTPEAIKVCTLDEVTKMQTTRQAKAAQAQAWADFLDRVQSNQILPEDSRYLKEVEALALGSRENSRLLRQLGRAENPEVAHTLLLKLGYWDYTVNPYPQRLGLSTTSPTIALPQLPDEERVDLTHLPAFAIDDEGSQDPDDALSLEGNRLWVHIADVAALVAPDSLADLEARTHGANLYLPEETISMLPPQATQTLALGLLDISPALSFGLDLDDAKRVIHIEVVPSLIRVQRLSYQNVETRLNEEPFAHLHRIAQANQKCRQVNGAISLDLPEVKIRVVAGEIVICPLPHLKSRDLVREAMLMTGEAIARFALEKDIPFPFTSQDAPNENGFATRPATVNIPKDSMAGMFALRRTLKRGQVKSIPGFHAGLGLELYTQATSPLRRYADLLAHQQLRAYLKRQKLLSTSQILERIGTADAISGNVRRAERLANKHWTLVYLINHPNWCGKGILVEKRNLQGVILIPELDLETRIHLPQDLPLNSAVSLTLNHVNLVELNAHFRIEKNVTKN